MFERMGRCGSILSEGRIEILELYVSVWYNSIPGGSISCELMIRLVYQRPTHDFADSHMGNPSIPLLC